MHPRLLSILTVMLVAVSAHAQTTQPASTQELELRATQLFTAGDYATALPLLKKVAVAYKDNPSKVDRLLEMVRVSERNLAATGALPTDGIPVSAETRKPHPAPQAGQVRELTIKELGNFEDDNDNGGNIPPDVQALSGSKVRVSGFMIPMDQAERITQFALVPDLFACCFGQPPQVQHTVVVNCPKGKAVTYYPDQIVVEGDLTVEEKKDDGFIISVFELTASSVRPAAK
jgi:hypothetical protein